MCFFFQCVPYLIAMGTDPEPTMKNKADQQLVEIDKKYSGFIHVSLLLEENEYMYFKKYSFTLLTDGRNYYVSGAMFFFLEVNFDTSLSSS